MVVWRNGNYKAKKNNGREIEIWPWTHIREAMGLESRPVWWED